MKKELILILEDEEAGKTYCASIQNAFPEYEVQWVKTENEVLDAIKKQKIAVIVFDQRLSNGELGTNVMSKVKRIDSSIVGIMLSARATPSDCAVAMAKKLMIEYVDKASINSLKGAVANAITIYKNNESELYIGQEEIDIDPKNRFLNFLARHNIIHPIKRYLISSNRKNSSIIFRDEWITLYVRNAGEKGRNEETHKLSREIQITRNQSSKFITETDLSLLKQNIVNKLSIESNKETNKTEKENNEMIQAVQTEYNMNEIPQDANTDYLSTVELQATQVFMEYEVTIKTVCGKCSSIEYSRYTLFIPTEKQVYRKKLYYTKSGTQIINIYDQEIVERDSRSV